MRQKTKTKKKQLDMFTMIIKTIFFPCASTAHASSGFLSSYRNAIIQDNLYAYSLKFGLFPKNVI